LAYKSALDYLNRVSPHPGDPQWNSFGASAAAFVAAVYTLPIGFIVIFVIQRIFAGKRDGDNLAGSDPPD
jgi:hypothetical protein